jgi:nucleotide-binding universal stress UspA family protein
LRAGLIVVGSHGARGLERMFAGSVSHHTALYADCSVRIGRRLKGREQASGGAVGGSVRVIIGWDHSQGAQSAVEAVAARAWPAGSRVRVVTALDTQLATFLPALAATAPALDASAANAAVEQEEWVRQQAREAVNRLRGAGLEVDEPVVREGSP